MNIVAVLGALARAISFLEKGSHVPKGDVEVLRKLYYYINKHVS